MTIQWKFSIKLRGENGEVEMSQEINTPIGNGPDVRQILIAKSIEAYKALEPKT